MPVFQELVDFDKMISQLRTPPTMINDLVSASEEDRESIMGKIFTKYSSDMLSVLPTCECGKTEGEYAVATECIHCGTPVVSPVGEMIEPLIWFRKPEGVGRLINPAVLTMLNARFKRSGFEVIKWLCDTTYRTPVNKPKVIDAIEAMGIKRGYNNFVDNFDPIMYTLFSMSAFKLKGKRKKGQKPVEPHDWLAELLVVFRDRLFSDYLPLPNKSLLIVEKTNVGVYIDTTIIGAINAISMLTSIDVNSVDNSIRVKENRTIKAIIELSEFYEMFYKNNISKKPGIYRRHVVASRSHFSFRAVASSITGVHKYDDIYGPWGVGVTLMREHLVNKLLKRGYSYNDAIGLLYAHVDVYHPLLDTLLKELISESRGQGLPCLLQRNPSLLMGSALFVRLAGFKPNPADITISASILVTKSLNLDFDGKYIAVFKVF